MRRGIQVDRTIIMLMEDEYNEAINHIVRLSKMSCKSMEEWAQTVELMFSLAMSMHNIVNLDRYFLQEEVKLLRARLDADSPIGRISGKN